MHAVCTYVRTCARSQGGRKVVKSEGAGTQTIKNLGVKVYTCYQEYYTVTKKCPTSIIILLILYMASFSYI